MGDANKVRDRRRQRVIQLGCTGRSQHYAEHAWMSR
jgi:hypothetical protein